MLTPERLNEIKQAAGLQPHLVYELHRELLSEIDRLRSLALPDEIVAMLDTLTLTFDNGTAMDYDRYRAIFCMEIRNWWRGRKEQKEGGK
jgi:hypothetical protein